MDHRIENRKKCLFRYPSLGHCYCCTIKDKMASSPTEPTNCDFYDGKELIPNDCPLREHDITVGLIKEEDKRYAIRVKLDENTCEYCRQFNGYIVVGKEELGAQMDNMKTHCKSKLGCRCVAERSSPLD